MWAGLNGLVQAGRGALGLGGEGGEGAGDAAEGRGGTGGASSSSHGVPSPSRRRMNLAGVGAGVEWDVHDAVEARLAELVAVGMEEGVARRRAREAGAEVGAWPEMEGAFLEMYGGAYAGWWPDAGPGGAQRGQPRAFAECLTLHLGERLAEVRARGAGALGEDGDGGGAEAGGLARAVEVAVGAAGVACRSRFNVAVLADTGRFLGVAGALLTQVSRRRAAAKSAEANALLERVETELAGLLPRFFNLGGPSVGEAWAARQFGAGPAPAPMALEVAARAAEAGVVGAMLKALQAELGRGGVGPGLSPMGMSLANALGHALTSGGDAPNTSVQALVLGFGAVDMLLGQLGALPGDEPGWTRLLSGGKAGGETQLLILRLVAQAVWKHPGSLAACVQGSGAARIGATLVCLAVLDGVAKESPPLPPPREGGGGIAPPVRERTLLHEAFQVMGAFLQSMGLDSMAAVRAGGVQEARKRVRATAGVATGLLIDGVMHAFRGGQAGGRCEAEVHARRGLQAETTLQELSLRLLVKVVAQRPLSVFLFRDAGVWDGWLMGPWVYEHPVALPSGLRAAADKLCDASLREGYLMGEAFTADESPTEVASLVYALGRYAETDLDALSALQRCITGVLIALGNISEGACSALVHALLHVGVLESVAKVLCDLRGRVATPEKDPMLDLAYHCTFELVEQLLKPALGSDTSSQLRLVICCDTFVAELIELLPLPDIERVDFALRALVALVHLEPGEGEVETEAHAQFLVRYLQAIPVAMSGDTTKWGDDAGATAAEESSKEKVLLRQSSSRTHRLSVAMSLLRGIQESLADGRRSPAVISKIQRVLSDLDAHTFILNLLARARFHSDPNLVCAEVIASLMLLLRGNADVKSAFYLCGGYHALATGLRETFSADDDLRMGQGVTKALLDFVVEEQVTPLAQIPQSLSIRNEHAVPLFLRVLHECRSSLGTKRLLGALDAFSAIALRNNGNRSACARFGLVGAVLGWLEEVDDADLVERLLKLFREVGGHSLGAQDLRRIVDSLKRVDESPRRSPPGSDKRAEAPLAGFQLNMDRASKMLRVLQQMVHSSSQPDVYFDFSGGATSGLFIADGRASLHPTQGSLYPTWPSAAKGYSISLWFRVEEVPGGTEGSEPRDACLASFCTAKCDRGFELVLRNKGSREGGIVLALCPVASGEHEACVEFDHPFEARRWYCICVTHAASMTRLLPTETRLYVNGALVHTDKLRYPRLGEPLAQSSFCASARAQGPHAAKSPVPFCGQAEGMRVFADCLDRKKASLLYSLGPRYKQAFLPCEWHADGSGAHQFSVGEGSLASTHLVAFHASAVTARTVGNAAIVKGALSINGEMRHRENWFARLGAGAEVSYAQGVGDALQLVGGIRALLPILQIVGGSGDQVGERGEADDSFPARHAIIIDTLSLIAAVLNSGKDHQLRFFDEQCPWLLGHLFKTMTPNFLTSDLVRVLQSLVQATLNFELLAIDILRHCLVDLEIWAAAKFSVQAEIWRFATDLADTRPAIVRAATCTRLHTVARATASATGQSPTAGSSVPEGRRTQEFVRLGSVDELLDNLRLFYWVDWVESISRNPSQKGIGGSGKASDKALYDRPSLEEIASLRTQVLTLATKLALANMHADPSTKSRRKTASRIADGSSDASTSHPFIEKLVTHDTAAFFKIAADQGGVLSDTCLAMMNLLLDPVVGPAVRGSFARCGGAHALLLIVVQCMGRFSSERDASKRDSISVARWLRLLFLYLVDSSKASRAEAPPPQGGAASTAHTLRTVFDSGTQLVGTAVGAATKVGKGVAGIIDSVQNLPQSLGLLGTPLLQGSVYEDILVEFFARLGELCMAESKLTPSKSTLSMNLFILHSFAGHLGSEHCTGAVYRGALSGMCNRSLPFDDASPLSAVSGDPIVAVLPQMFGLIIGMAASSVGGAGEGGNEPPEGAPPLDVVKAAHGAVLDLLHIAGVSFNNREVLAIRVDWQAPLLRLLAASGDLAHRETLGEERRRAGGQLQRDSGRLLRMLVLHAFRHLKDGWAYLLLVWRHVQRLGLSNTFLYGTAIEVLAFAQRERVSLLALETTSPWLTNLAFVLHMVEELMETQAGQEPSMLEMCTRALDVVTAFQLPTIVAQSHRFAGSALSALKPFAKLGSAVNADAEPKLAKVESTSPSSAKPEGADDSVGGGALSTDERVVDGLGCGHVAVKSLLLVLRYASYDDAARAVQQGLVLFPAAFSLAPPGGGTCDSRDRLHGFLHQLVQLLGHFQDVADERPRGVLLRQLLQQCVHRCFALIDADMVRSVETSPTDVVDPARVAAYDEYEHRVGEGIRARVQAEARQLELANLSTKTAGANYARQSEALMKQLREVLVTLDDKRIRLGFIHEEEDAAEAHQLWTRVLWDLTDFGGLWTTASRLEAQEHWCLDTDAQEPRNLVRRRLRKNHTFDPHVEAVRDPSAAAMPPEFPDGPEALKGLGAFVARSGAPKDDPFGDEEDEEAGGVEDEREDRPVDAQRQAASTELDAKLKQDIDAEKNERERVALADQSSRDKPFFRAPCQMVTASRLVGGIFEVSRIRIIFTPNKKYGPDPFEGLDRPNAMEGVHVTMAHPTMPPYSPSSNEVESRDKRRRYMWRLTALRRVYARRYVMRFTALELFFGACEDCGTRGVFINFLSKADTRLAARNLVQLSSTAQRAYNIPWTDRVQFISPRRRANLAAEAADAWAKREISNFDYLMRLNDLSGRGYNDLAQYPVFPWILSDYDSETLDLTLESTFRDLSKPMGALSPNRLEQVLERYRTFSDGMDEGTPPFMYGSHYSSPGAVLFYLIRLEPFTSMYIDLQGGKFDHADRMFLDVGQTWKNASSAPGDLKELIPEFFYLPEMFQNADNFDFGTTQQGKRVGDVALPRWSGGDPHTFVRMHREALESEHVSQMLHHWVDLVFGHKQTGSDAVKACNVFHHLSYEGSIDIEAIADPGLRASTEATVINFGQTPSRLFTRASPRRLPNISLALPLRNAPDAVALHRAYPVFPSSRHGAAVSAIHAVPLGRGSGVALQGGCPLRVTVASSEGCLASLLWHPAMREESSSGVNATTRRSSYRLDMDAAEPRAIGTTVSRRADLEDLQRGRGTPLAVGGSGKLVVSGGHWDGSFRISDVTSGRLLDVVCLHRDIVTCVATDGDCVVAGCRDSSLSVWRGVIPGSGTADGSDEGLPPGNNNNLRVWSRALGLRGTERPAHILRGHASSVTCVRVSVAMDLVASGNGQGALALHGLRTGQHLRTLWHPDAADLDRGRGAYWDQCMLCESEGLVLAYSHDDLCLRTFSINGVPIATVDAGERVRALAVNTLTRGDCLVVGGERTGVSVRRLSDLALVRRYDGAAVPGAVVTSLCVTAEESILAGTADGHVAVYTLDPASLKTLRERLDAQRAALNSAVVSNAINAAVTGVTGALSSLLTPTKRSGG